MSSVVSIEKVESEAYSEVQEQLLREMVQEVLRAYLI